MPLDLVRMQLSLNWTMRQLLSNERTCQLLSEGIGSDAQLRNWAGEATGWRQVINIQEVWSLECGG